VPAAAVIPAQIAYTKIAAVKKLVVGGGRARWRLRRDATAAAFASAMVWTRFPAGAVRALRGVGSGASAGGRRGPNAALTSGKAPLRGAVLLTQRVSEVSFGARRKLVCGGSQRGSHGPRLPGAK